MFIISVYKKLDISHTNRGIFTTKNLIRLIFMFFIILIMGSGCAGISQLPEAEKGLNITESTYAVGAASEANNGEIQVFFL